VSPGNGGRGGARAERLSLPRSRKPRVLVVSDPGKPEALEAAERVADHLQGRARVLDVETVRSRDPIRSKPDLVVVLGGDGAMLAVSFRLGKRQVPVLGVNFGRVGFLAGVSREHALRVLDRALEGRAALEEHAMMHARIRRQGRVLLDTHILNEIAIQRTWGSSMVEVDLTVDRRPVCQYRGDGVIVATATGSTAYSLAAGGPVLSPRLDAFVVTPLAPYMLGMRPLVLPGHRVAALTVHQDAGFTADGHEEHRLHPGDVVRVGPSRRRFRLVVDTTFYDRLRGKLGWGVTPGDGEA